MLPKIIWTYWDQGFNSAPEIIKICNKSLNYYKDDFEVRALDQKSILDYISLDKKFFSDVFPKAQLSDILRVLLLYQYGGIWCDATILFNRNINLWIDDLSKSNFFCFFSGGLELGSWFLISKKKSYIISKMKEFFVDKWLDQDFFHKMSLSFNKWPQSGNYYLFHKTFNKLAQEDPKFREYVDAIPRIYNRFDLGLDYFNLSHHITTYMKEICDSKKYPLFKLSHKIDFSELEENTLVKYAVRDFTQKSFTNEKKYHIHDLHDIASCFMHPTIVNDSSNQYAGVMHSHLSFNNTFKDFAHIINMPSYRRKNFNSQIIVPFGKEEIFIRSSNGLDFHSLRKVAFDDQLESILSRIDILEKKIDSFNKDKNTDVINISSDNINSQFYNLFVRESGIEFETFYWKQKIASLKKEDNYFIDRLDSKKQLEEDLAKLVEDNNSDKVSILDVGCGPLSSLGKFAGSKKIELVGIDPLSDIYKKILEEKNIFPHYKSINGSGENLEDIFLNQKFDLVYSCNALDHSIDPIKCIQAMINVCKDGGYICFDVFENEAVNGNYMGFHQWNFQNLHHSICIYNKSKAYILNDIIKGLPYIFIIEKTSRNVIYKNKIRIYIYKIDFKSLIKVENCNGLYVFHNIKLNTVTFIKGKSFKNFNRFFIHFKSDNEIIDGKSFYWDTNNDMISVFTEKKGYNNILIGQYEYSYKNEKKVHKRFWEYSITLK